uniref:PDZ domain-containing protein n=1 Tax=Strongyloides papillosus TaxID=174720 RepID=A0A0N5CAY2_STREA
MQCVEQIFFCKNTCSKKNREQFLAKDEIDCFRANITGGESSNKYPSSEHKSLKTPIYGGNRAPVPPSTSETAIKSITTNVKGLNVPYNKPSSKTSSNILLKQALANRINNPQFSEGTSKEYHNNDVTKETKKENEKGNNIEVSHENDELLMKNDEDKRSKVVSRKDSDEMTSSILLSPAWYRDSEGKTGIKEKVWEKLPNQQKCPVKHKKDDKNRRDSEVYDGENIYQSIRDEFDLSLKDDKHANNDDDSKLRVKNNEKSITSPSEDKTHLQVNDNSEFPNTTLQISDNYKNRRKVSINSEQSKNSSMSRKSVTFSDQVVINEISRRLDGDKHYDFRIGGNFDDSLYSDEEIPSTLTAVTIIRNKDDLPPSHVDSSLEVSRELQKEFSDYNNDDPYLKQPFVLGPNVEKSIYFDETLGANVYLLEDNSSEDEYQFDAASLNLPESVKRALKAEALARKRDISSYERDITIGCLYGSMSRLHAEDSPIASLHNLHNSNTTSPTKEEANKKKKVETSINDRAYDGEGGETSKLTTEIGGNIVKNDELLSSEEDSKHNKVVKGVKNEKLVEGDKVDKEYLSPNSITPSLSKKEYKKKKKKVIQMVLSEDTSTTSPDSEYEYHRRLSTISGSPNPSHNSRISTKSSLSPNAQKPPPGNVSPSRSNSVTSCHSIKKNTDQTNSNIPTPATTSTTKQNQEKPFIRSASGYFEPPDLSKQIIHLVEVGDTSDIVNSSKDKNAEGKGSNVVLKRVPKPLPPKEPGGESIQRSYYDNVSYGGVFTPPEDMNNVKSVILKNEKVNESKESKIPKLNTITTEKESKPSESDLEKVYKEKFMNTYSKRKAPLVVEESEEIAPKDPDHSSNYGLGPNTNRGRKNSMTSNSSRESVISATSYKAEIKVRRNFNY